MEQPTEPPSLPPMISTCRHCGRAREEHYDRGERGSLACTAAHTLFEAGLTRKDVELQLSNLNQSYQRLYDEKVQLQEALTELLDLDARRPIETTWWRKWWDEARARAEALLTK